MMVDMHPDVEQEVDQYGIVLGGKIYQGLFSYTVAHRIEFGSPDGFKSNVDEKLFFRLLPLRSLAPSVCYGFLVALISISVWQGWLTDLSVSGSLVFDKGEYWRYFTAQFQHADSKHLLNNLLPFIGLGWFLWGYFGFLAFPVLPVVSGTVANFFAIFTYNRDSHLVGISGTVFAMAGMWSALYIKNDYRFSVRKRILRASGFVVVLFFPLSLEANVADRVHIIGGLVGFLCGYFGWGELIPQKLIVHKSSVKRVRVL